MAMKVRIKGANSDYEFSPDGVTPVKPLQARMEAEAAGEKAPAEPLPDAYLQIFICPYGMPSRIEEPKPGPKPYCEGTDESCPNDGRTAGHAVIQLHEKEGIKLATDKQTQLVVEQGGAIRLEPATEVQVEKPLRVTGQATVNGPLAVNPTGQQTVLAVDQAGTIKLTPLTRTEVSRQLVVNGQSNLNGNVVIQPAGGPQLSISSAGGGVSIQANGATVAIDSSGNINLTPAGSRQVTVNGRLNIGGQLQLSPAAIAYLRQALGLS